MATPLLRPEALAAVNKYVLEHLSFDRLLQDRDLSKPAIDALGTVSGHKDKRHAQRQHRIGHRIDHFAVEIDVENGRLKVSTPDRGHRIRHAAERTDHIKTEI